MPYCLTRSLSRALLVTGTSSRQRFLVYWVKRACRLNPCIMPPTKYWEMVADKDSAAGWTCGYCSAATQHGWRWVVDAYYGDGRRYIANLTSYSARFSRLNRLRLFNGF